MLTLGRSSRRHYREPHDKKRIYIRLLVVVGVLAIFAGLAWIGYRWYQSLSEQPPMSVTYIHHDTDKKTPQLYQQMKLTRGEVTTPVSFGQTGTISVHSVSGAKCEVNLYFRGGNKADDKTMRPKTASDNGTVTWTWLVKKKYSSGIWPYTIECRNPTGVEKIEGKITITDPHFNH